MDKLTSLKFDKVYLSDHQKKMYVDLMKNNKKLLKVMKIIKDNTVNKNNPGAEGVTKDKIMEQGLSKFYTDNYISFLLGATFIYYDTTYDCKGKYYSLTSRGSEIYIELVKREMIIND